MATTSHSWSETDFDNLSWHDNHIHGLAVRGGEYGVGDLVLDIDFILEWLCDSRSGSCQFRIAPATLTFHEVSDLVIALNYAEPSATIGAASIGEIARVPHVYPNGYSSFRWSVTVNWPTGSIDFVASGFTQVLRASPILVSEQCLSAEQRQALLWDKGGRVSLAPPIPICSEKT